MPNHNHNLLLLHDLLPYNKLKGNNTPRVPRVSQAQPLSTLSLLTLSMPLLCTKVLCSLKTVALKGLNLFTVHLCEIIALIPTTICVFISLSTYTTAFAASITFLPINS